MIVKRSLFSAAPVPLLIPVLAAMLLVGVQGPEGSGEGYATAVVANTISGLAFTIPLMCVGSAWEAGRIRAAGVLRLPWARPVAAILGPSIAFAATPLVILYLATVLFQATPRGRDWILVSFGVLLIGVWAFLAFAMGLLLPRIVALPAALIVAGVTLILPVANYPFWIRHVTGTWTGCCHTNEVFSGQVLGASSIVVGVLLITAVMAIWYYWRARATMSVANPATAKALVVAVAVTLVPGVLLIPLAASMVEEFHYSAAEPRPAAEVVCDEGQPTLCLWPEHEKIRAETRKIADAAFSVWRERGIVVPAALDESVRRPTADRRPLVISTGSMPDEMLSSVASGVAGADLCPVRFDGYLVVGPDDPAVAASEHATQVAQAWLVTEANPGQDLSQVLPPPVTSELMALRRQPAEVQRDLINAAIANPPVC